MFKWITIGKALKKEGVKVTYKNRTLVWDKKRKEWVVYEQGIGKRWILISTTNSSLAAQSLIE